MTDDDIQKILHRAAELQGIRSLESVQAPTVSDVSDQQRLGFVAEAAEQVGIHRDDFALATAELSGSPTQKSASPRTVAKARRWLRFDERIFSFDASISATPKMAMATLQSVLASEDYRVAIANVVGEDPLVDGVLVLEPADYMQLVSGQVTEFRMAMLAADFRQVLITVRKASDASGHTLVQLHTSLDHSAVLNYRVYSALTWFIAALAGIGVSVLAASGGPLAVLGLGAVAVGGAYLALKTASRRLFRWSLHDGQKALRKLAVRWQQAVRLKGLDSTDSADGDRR